MRDTHKELPRGSHHVRRKFAVIIGLFVAVIVGIFLFTLLIFESQKTDALVIDLAGRQRMLHQRHMTEIVLRAQGHGVESGNTREALRQTLSALTEGGEAPLTVGGREFVTLPPSPTRIITDTLQAQQRLAGEFAAKADRFLQLSRDDTDYQARLQELLALSGQLQEVSNDAVRLFDAHSEAKLSALISLEIVVALLVGFVGVLLTRRVMRANQDLQAEIHERRQAEAALRESEEKLRSDIAERKLTEQELIESREKLHRVTDAIPGAVYQYMLARSGEQRFLYVSRGVQELLGLTAQQATADFTLVWALTHPDDVTGLRASIERSAQTLRPWSHEFRVFVDGRIKWLRGSSVPEQPKPDGTIIWNGILADITEGKHAEEELRKSREKTIAALQQSDALKSALLSSVSHELRTPLAAIKAMVSSAFKRGATASLNVQGEFFDAMNREVDYLNRLVDNLLDMSRIEAGAMIPQREWQLLEDIVEGAIRRVGPDMKERLLEIKIDDDLPPVHVDAVEIQQVLVNLLDNAIKYSPAHSPVRLTATRVGDAVEVRVCNGGPGVGTEDRARIFERFYRAPNSADARVRGTGLGLAICKGVVEAHGGSIWCHSVPGVETSMTFTIPLAPEPAKPMTNEEACPARSEP